MRVSVTNLYSDEIGNPQLPSKLQAVRKHRAHVRWAEIAAALLVLGAIIAGVFFLARRPTTSALRVLDKSIAVLPFENRAKTKRMPTSPMGCRTKSSPTWRRSPT